MMSPIFSAADFQRALSALMPRGRVWPKEPDALQEQTLGVLAPSFARNAQAALALLVDAFPATTQYLMPEWEVSLGLPDPCAGGASTLIQRRNQIVARLTNVGGQSASYFQRYAQALGYAIEITNYAPFRMGQSYMGQPLGNPDWFYTWSINAPPETVTYFTMGQSGVNEPLASWNNDVLMCEMRAATPAHTILFFTFNDGGPELRRLDGSWLLNGNVVLTGVIV